MTDTKFKYLVVNLATDSTTVTTENTLLRGFQVTTALSAHDCPIYDGSGGNLIAKIPASAGVGTWIECGDVRLENGVFMDPDNAATGVVTCVYKSAQNFVNF